MSRRPSRRRRRRPLSVRPSRRPSRRRRPSSVRPSTSVRRRRPSSVRPSRRPSRRRRPSSVRPSRRPSKYYLQDRRVAYRRRQGGSPRRRFALKGGSVQNFEALKN